MNILLFGKGGQVGWELQRSLAPLGVVTAVDFDSIDLCGDLTDADGIARTVRAVKPDVIVNAAAHTAVDKAESEADLARAINALGPATLAREANKIGAWLIHYSTDYVFDGSGTRPWREADRTSPLSVYGQTKLEGEEAIRQECERHVILRTSWVYGARGGNFAKTMLRLAAEREVLNVIDDQIGAPTGADLLADVTAHVVRASALETAITGTYHCAASGETSWHGYAGFVIDTARALARELKVREVNAVPTSAYPTAATRPLNSRLDTSKLRQTFELALPPWQQGVARMLTEFLSN